MLLRAAEGASFITTALRVALYSESHTPPSIRSRGDGHPGCFRFGATKDTAALNALVTCVLLLQAGGELLGHGACVGHTPQCHTVFQSACARLYRAPPPSSSYDFLTSPAQL